MALLQSSYQRPFWLRGGHLQTLLPFLLRKTPEITCQRQRLDLVDNDFIDLDVYKQNSKKYAIISHGMEGDSRRHYVLAMAQALYQNGYNVIAWNMRGCSGEPNRLFKAYYGGCIDDLDSVVKFTKKHKPQKLVLVGFSLGGNVTLEYLAKKKVSKIAAAITFSVPVDMADSGVEFEKKKNILYKKFFLEEVKQKVKLKEHLIGAQHLQQILAARTIRQFDNLYTAPTNGFKDADDYYVNCSAIYSLHRIKTPTLIVNALNDPFLGDRCYPVKEAARSKYISLEIPTEGGHVGFFDKTEQFNWPEKRALDFLSTLGLR